MASDAYLKIDGINGESEDDRHRNWIEVNHVLYAVRGAVRMRTTMTSLGVALLVVALVYISIFFFDPGMNVEKAFNIIFYSFVGAAVVTAFVLKLRSGKRKA